MEEDEYRQMYRAAIPQRCLFEKAVLSRRCACSQSRRHNLAEREAVACESVAGYQRCERWLALLRTKALFALHIRETDQPLPHAKEIKVQAGGLLGLCEVVDVPLDGAWREGERVSDVAGLLAAAERQFGELEALPFECIVRTVVNFKGRDHRRRKAKRPE